MMKLSQDGSLLVTASSKGTLLRIYATGTGEMVEEVRRGADQAVITDISIDPENKYVCCASDKGTIHIFSIDHQSQMNKQSSWRSMKGVLSYFGSNWSFSQLKAKDRNCKCAIIGDKIFVIST